VVLMSVPPPTPTPHPHRVVRSPAVTTMPTSIRRMVTTPHHTHASHGSPTPHSCPVTPHYVRVYRSHAGEPVVDAGVLYEEIMEPADASAVRVMSDAATSGPAFAPLYRASWVASDFVRVSVANLIEPGAVVRVPVGASLSFTVAASLSLSTAAGDGGDWSSDDPATVHVERSTGHASVHRPGLARVTYAQADGGSDSGHATIKAHSAVHASKLTAVQLQVTCPRRHRHRQHARV
jgi:hypothetical protein